MLKLSKTQYKQLCADCAAEMMRGAGHGGKIPDFSSTDMTFYVKDPHLKGGGLFTASCDIEPTGCAFAWFLLLLSVVAHALHYCGGDEGESDDGEPNTMYS